MKSFNIYGDWTDDTDQWVYCQMCHALLTWHQWEDGLCHCGADLGDDADKSILSGKALRQAREMVDATQREWNELNTPFILRVTTKSLDALRKEYP